jgi:hypothetical protein
VTAAPHAPLVEVRMTPESGRAAPNAFGHLMIGITYRMPAAVAR